MVFEGFKSMFKPRSRDAFDPKGLEGFTPEQRNNIISKIKLKESQLMELKADNLAEERIKILEKRLGIKPKEEIQGRKKFRELRLGNIERQKERTRVFNQNEKDFRDGKLGVKPVGPKPAVLEKKTTAKITVKEIKLKAPPSSIK